MCARREIRNSRTSSLRLMPSSCPAPGIPARGLSKPGSEGEQHLGGAALVHRLVALGRLLQREGEVEDLARVDLSVPDELDQLGQEPAHRRRATEGVDAGEEQI